MATSFEHYEMHLAPVYEWMCGGFDAACAQGAADLEFFGIEPGGGHAIDLGCGFGAHAIPLATMGYRVTAVDSSGVLLSKLQARSRDLHVTILAADLALLDDTFFDRVGLVLCMGDTITHLESRASVGHLVRRVARGLEAGGRFVLTFRDYVQPPSGEARFIPVRADADLIHTCFLETFPDRILVHDLLNERTDMGWQLRVSSYPKLRLAPGWLRECFEQNGLNTKTLNAPRGMIGLIGTKPATSRAPP